MWGQPLDVNPPRHFRPNTANLHQHALVGRDDCSTDPNWRNSDVDNWDRPVRGRDDATLPIVSKLAANGLAIRNSMPGISDKLLLNLRRVKEGRFRRALTR